MSRYILRHGPLARFTHWVHVSATIALILSGLVIFVPVIAQMVGQDAVQAIRIGHRVFAVLFIAVPLISAIRSPDGFVHMMKGIFAPWDADDKRFAVLFVPYLFAPKKIHMPKQHETKSGQRIADGALVLFAILISISGIVLWAGIFVGPVVLRIALLAHDISFMMLAVLVTAHAYLGAGVFQPYRRMARVMFGDGLISESDARYHWGHWAEEKLVRGEDVVEK